MRFADFNPNEGMRIISEPDPTSEYSYTICNK